MQSPGFGTAIQRLIRSSQRYGVYSNIRRIWTFLIYRVVGTDFSPERAPRTLGEESSFTHSNGYMTSPRHEVEHQLRIVLRSTPESARGTFVDIGCGKGEVLYAASKLGFSEVVGVELDPSLAHTACLNLLRLRANPNRVRVQVCDARNFSLPENTSVIWLFNSFDEEVLRECLRQWVGANLRVDLRIIYVNPQHQEPFEEEPRISTVYVDEKIGTIHYNLAPPTQP